MYQLGLVSISFRKHSPEEIISAVVDAGLSCIEWGSDVHALYNDTERLTAIAAAQNAAGLKCSSYGTYYRLGVDRPEDIRGYIEAAKLLGTDILRLWCGNKGSQEYTPEELETLYADCRAVARIAEENGVKLCMECHNNTLTDSKEPALALMQAVNSPAFRMYWQPNQRRTLEENLAYARLLAPYTDHIHVFNWEGNAKYPLEEAVEIWKEYLAEFPGDRALLLEFMPDNRIETLKQEAAALRKIVGE